MNKNQQFEEVIKILKGLVAVVEEMKTEEKPIAPKLAIISEPPVKVVADFSGVKKGRLTIREIEGTTRLSLSGRKIETIENIGKCLIDAASQAKKIQESL